MARFCGGCGTLVDQAERDCWACGLGLPEPLNECATAGVSAKGLARRHGVEPKTPTGERALRANDSSSSCLRKRATVDEVCAKCGTRGLSWHAVQLRSADEGQTVFTECFSCGHTEQLDT